MDMIMELPRAAAWQTAGQAAVAGDFDAAHRMAAAALARNPTDVRAHCDIVHALTMLRRLDEADEAAERALALHPGHQVLLIEHAWVAHYARNFSEAHLRWHRVQHRFPHHSAGAVGIGRSLFELREFAGAEAHLRDAMEQFPDDLHLLETAARTAGALELWQDAVNRWDRLATHRPLNEHDMRDRGLCLWHLEVAARAVAMAQAEEGGEADCAFNPAAHAPGPVDVGRVTDEVRQALVLKFESLGANCEFGLVQRHYGAEPVDLLRWTGIDPDRLANLLEARCAGLGDKRNLILNRTPWTEYVIDDSVYQFGFHTFLMTEVTDEARFIAHQSTRIRWLRQVLLQNLAAAKKIFVYKDHEGASVPQRDRVFRAVRAYGPNRLLWVSLADADHPAGSVEMVEPGLIQGFISRRNPAPDEAWDIPFDEWIEICEQTLVLFGG